MTPREVYPKSGAYILIIHDLSVPGTLERLLRELAAWRGRAQIEALDAACVALMIRPGLAARIATSGLPNTRCTS